MLGIQDVGFRDLVNFRDYSRIGQYGRKQSPCLIFDKNLQIDGHPAGSLPLTPRV